MDADYSDRNVADVVVRNIGRGAAKEISFDFSAPMVHSFLGEGSEFVPLNELPYFKDGIETFSHREQKSVVLGILM